MRWAAALMALMLCGCAPETPAVKTEAPVAPVKDDTMLLPALHRVSAAVVPNHILGKAFLPGGTLGNYESKGTQYQLFIVRAENNQKAAFLLVDMRKALANPEYIAYMGGYFGSDAGAPVYTFAKLQYLAGVVGLPKDQADPIARTLASRLQ